VPQELLPYLGESDPGGIAHEQGQADHFFQLSDGSGYGGLRDIQVDGRTADLPALARSDEISDLAQ